MTASEHGGGRARARRLFDVVECAGLIVLLTGLPVSEAAKSAGLILAALGFLGLRLSGAPFPERGRGPLIALGLFYLIAAASVLAAAPYARQPETLASLALTVFVFPALLDAARSPSRRALFAGAILVGGAIAAVAGYADYMSDRWLRLALPSIENAVPAAEYLAAVTALALAVLLAAWRGAVVGPSVAFTLGVSWLTLLMTKSRGPMLGAAGGAVAALCGSLRRRHAVLVLAVLAAGVVLFWRTHPEARAVDDLAVGSRAAVSRVYTWHRTVQLIAERPVLGHGLGSFKSLMVVYRDEAGAIHQGNAHNALLHVTVETGFLGCGALLVFLVLGIRGVWRAIRAAPPSTARAISTGALAGVVAILVAGAFSVSIDAEPGMLFYALLALGQSGRR